MAHCLFARSFLFTFVIFLANIRGYYAYDPPEVKVEPLHPTGLRLSIPDENGITLVAFHIKFNEDFSGLEAGHIANDILKVRNGRWTYEDRNTMLKRDDIIYYWVHVVYQGLGYNKVDQSYRVVDFYNYDGIKQSASAVQSEQNCPTPSATLIIDKDGERRQTCPHQLLFVENFDNLNDTIWNSVRRFAGAPNFEFIVYMTNEVTDISDGRLRIRPTLVDTKFGKDFVKNRELIIEGCTGKTDTDECRRQPAGSYILPPVMSGRINTKGKFEFLFGRIEIRAKLPRGDWIYPILILEQAENEEQAREMYHEIRIASSVGNGDLTSIDNENISGHILYAGGLTTVLRESTPSINRAKLSKRPSSQMWANEYHIFVIEWKSGLITMKVDGVQYGEQVVDSSFAKPSYITLGVAVGGIHEFPDHAASNDYVKPWRNIEAKAMHNFYKAKDHWYPTWSRRTVLEVDYVKVWAL